MLPRHRGPGNQPSQSPGSLCSTGPVARPKLSETPSDVGELVDQSRRGLDVRAQLAVDQTRVELRRCEVVARAQRRIESTSS